MMRRLGSRLAYYHLIYQDGDTEHRGEILRTARAVTNCLKAIAVDCSCPRPPKKAPVPLPKYYPVRIPDLNPDRLPIWGPDPFRDPLRDLQPRRLPGFDPGWVPPMPVPASPGTPWYGHAWNAVAGTAVVVGGAVGDAAVGTGEWVWEHPGETAVIIAAGVVIISTGGSGAPAAAGMVTAVVR